MRFPELSATASAVRIYQLLDTFRMLKNPIRVTFIAPQPVDTNFCRKFQSDFQSEFDQFQLKTIDCNDVDAMNELLAGFVDNRLNVCVFDSMIAEEMYSFRARELLDGNSIFVTDTQDLRSVRNFRMEQLRGNEPFCVTDLPNAFNELLIRELSSIYRSDLSLIVSSDEMKYLKQVYGVPQEKLSMASFFYDPPTENSQTPFTARQNFVTIGNGIHPPNKDSIYYMRHYIWPKLKSQLSDPSVEYHIYGAYLDNYHSLTSKDLKFTIKGRLSDLNDLSKYRVNMCMLRGGAGIKGKIADGWLRGLPAISMKG